MAGNNYLSAEELLIARLYDQVPELHFVGGSRSVKEVTERLVATPAALIVWAGDTISENNSAGNGAAQIVTQKWHVEIIVNNDEDVWAGSGERVEAGNLITKVIAALAGWAPSDEHREMRRVQSASVLYAEGYGYYPLSFTTDVMTK